MKFAKIIFVFVVGNLIGGLGVYFYQSSLLKPGTVVLPPHKVAMINREAVRFMRPTNPQVKIHMTERFIEVLDREIFRKSIGGPLRIENFPSLQRPDRPMFGENGRPGSGDCPPPGGTQLENF